MNNNNEKDFNKDRIIKFCTIKMPLRLSAFFISSIILYLNISTMAQGKYSIIAISFAFIFFIAGLYQNSWQFNITKKEALYKHGLIFLYKTRIVNFADIHSIEIETFKRPARFGTFSEIKMTLVDGEQLVIDNDKTKVLRRELDEILEVQQLIKQNAEKKACDFFNSVVTDILNI